MSHFKAPPKKQLGQHFLTDRNVIAQILLAIDPRPGERLVEIGPGQGAITLPLLKQHHALTVIEFDRDLITPLAISAEGLAPSKQSLADFYRTTHVNGSTVRARVYVIVTRRMAARAGDSTSSADNDLVTASSNERHVASTPR